MQDNQEHQEHQEQPDWATQATFDAETIARHQECGPECPVKRAIAAQEQPDQEQEDYPNKGPFFGNSFAGLGNGPAGDYEDDEQEQERRAEAHAIPGADVLAEELAGAQHQGQQQEADMLAFLRASRREREKREGLPENFIFCVHGCYTLQYANDLESGGPGWYPLQWLDGAWRAYFSVGHFELVTLRFPTYQEGLEYLYGQP